VIVVFFGSDAASKSTVGTDLPLVTICLALHWPCITDITGSPPTGSRPWRGRSVPTYTLLVEYGKLYLYLKCWLLLAKCAENRAKLQFFWQLWEDKHTVCFWSPCHMFQKPWWIAQVTFYRPSRHQTNNQTNINCCKKMNMCIVKNCSELQISRWTWLPCPKLCLTLNYWVATLSLHFNDHFPGEPGLAGVYWSKEWWKWWWQL